MNLKPPADRLYHLLPYHYRNLDAGEGGGALRDLLRVMEEQFDVVERDIAQMYDDWFIETCADWAVPYLGDLAGWQPVQAADLTGADAALLRWLAPRRDVANTLRHRRRKGTLPLLEELARDVAGWPARAVEAGFSQENHSPPPADAAPNLEPVSISLHVWRLQVFPVTRTPAGDNTNDRETFRFSMPGHDAPLFTAPGDSGNLSLPRALTLQEISVEATDGGPPRRVSAEYYGPGRSFAIHAPDWPEHGAPQPVPRERIIPADLSGWDPGAWPPEGFIAVDPVLGRFAFPEGRGPDRGVEVSYYTGFSAPMGGGEYRRSLAQMENAVIYRVAKGGTLQEGLNLWSAERDSVRDAIIEFESSGVYNGFAHLELKTGETLQIRAAQGVRPILQLRKLTGHGAGTLSAEMEPGARLVLDGVIISDGLLLLRRAGQGGRRRKSAAAEISDEPECPAAVIIRHCTLVPGWSFKSDCAVEHPDRDSIELDHFQGNLIIQRSITGSIAVNADEAGADPAAIEICDSIVDATSRDLPAVYDNNYNPASPDEGPWAHVILTMRRCTVFGRVRVHLLPLAENTIFCGALDVARRRPGCLRFCWTAPGGRRPARYECQPEKAMKGASPGWDGDLENIDAAAQEALDTIRPQFVSEAYGHPAYAQLHPGTPDPIRGGADDHSEMGAFHDLFQPQRETSLRARLEEFVPAGCATSVVFET